MRKIAYLSDFPFSLGYGGKEIQLQTYLNVYLNEDRYKGFLVDYWDKNILSDSSVLHLFGYSVWYAAIINSTRIKYPNIKIVLSPNFYRNSFFLYKYAFHCFKKIPVKNYFSYINNVLSGVDSIIVNSNSEGLQIKKLVPCANVEVIYNGIEDNYEEYIPFKSNYENYILSVGFFDERKNTINALIAYLESYKHHGKKLILVGENRFTSERDVIKFNKILSNNSDKIINLGYINRNNNILKNLYSGCDIHYMPSLLETPGLSNLEALAFNKNIVVGHCDPIREYLDKIPYYCNPNYIDSIRVAILDALVNKDNRVALIPDYLRYSNISIKLMNAYDKLFE